MNKPTLKYAATEALAMLEEAIELFGSGEKGDQILANLRFALAEEFAEIDALKDSLHRADIDARNFCQQSIDRLAEIQQLKAENELNLAANRGLGRLVDVLQAENERLRADAERNSPELAQVRFDTELTAYAERNWKVKKLLSEIGPYEKQCANIQLLINKELDVTHWVTYPVFSTTRKEE